MPGSPSAAERGRGLRHARCPAGTPVGTTDPGTLLGASVAGEGSRRGRRGRRPTWQEPGLRGRSVLHQLAEAAPGEGVIAFHTLSRPFWAPLLPGYSGRDPGPRPAGTSSLSCWERGREGGSCVHHRLPQWEVGVKSTGSGPKPSGPRPAPPPSVLCGFVSAQRPARETGLL